MVRVFGDIGLDVWLWGTPTRLAQEAPWVPVFRLGGSPEISLGCAGNVAAVLSVNGITAQLVGRVGAGYWGSAAIELMERAGIDTTHVTVDRQTTTLKIRGGYIEDGRRIITGRWDLDRTADAVCCSAAAPSWKDVDGLIISDYAKDVLVRDGDLLRDVPDGIPVVADMKWRPSRRFHLRAPVWYALPNADEFTARWGRRPGCPLEREDAVAFLEPNRLTHGIVVTLASQGALYYDFTEGGGHVVPMHVRPAALGPGIYPCGAGDVFTARFAVEVIAGADIKRATEAAVEASSVAATTGVVEWERMG